MHPILQSERRIFPASTMALALLALALHACGQEASPNLDGADQVVTLNQHAECVGRFVINLPSVPVLPEANPNYDRIADLYELPDETGVGPAGRMRYATLDFWETRPLPADSEFKRAEPAIWADWLRQGVHDYLRYGGGDSRGKPVPVNYPLAFGMRDGGIVFFGTYLKPDLRARFLEGRLSYIDPDDTGAADTNPDNQRKAKAVIDTIWPRYQAREPGTLPKAAGFCTPYGIFADPKGKTERRQSFDLPMLLPSHSNLLVNLIIATRTKEDGELKPPQGTTLENWETPWEWDAREAKENRDNCKQNNGTASRGLGCMFSGARFIKGHGEVEYLTFANGQRGRLYYLQYHVSAQGFAEYEIRAETIGEEDSPSQPRVKLSVFGVSSRVDDPRYRGKAPIPIGEAMALTRAMAQSLRLREGAIAADAQVVDSVAEIIGQNPP
ncbi:hypothetical protein [Chitinimonas taiwanensis]|uniref:hypothetical protein n=1 Tax=Chitinimonas taiwanensis TaxID=240412 RepID=UPI0035B0F957